MRPFDRSRLRFRPLSERRSKLRVDEILVDPDGPAPEAGPLSEALDRVAERVRTARGRGAPVILCHGAHLIRNGLGPVVIRLLEEGWLSHVATNGAGSIHDWEFAFAGKSTEDVRANVALGRFGIWQETGFWPGLALLTGALEGLGYGRSVGRLIATEQVVVPDRQELLELAKSALEASPERCAAAADLLAALDAMEVPTGVVEVPHPWKATSVQAAASTLDVPLTVHPGVGQDIAHTHPLFRGGALGRTAMQDFLDFAASVEQLEGGVYISVGSSVMSPMVFEKCLSMARNVRLAEGKTVEDFDIVVNDLAPMTWDWSRGEPAPGDPAYYVRFCKSFSRMGGRLTYVGADNRLFLQNLYARLA